MHAGAVGLYHCRVAVDVYHEAGEEVAFAVHQAEAVVVGPYEAKCPAQAKGRVEPAVEEVVGKSVGIEFEYSHGDRSDLVVAYAEHPSVGALHYREVAFLKS